MVTTVKQVRLRPKLYPSQFTAKASEIRGLLASGTTVDLVVQMRGREVEAAHVAEDTMRRMVVEVLGPSGDAGPIQRDGDSLSVRIDP
jgi:translation initiation factor IF-3